MVAMYLRVGLALSIWLLAGCGGEPARSIKPTPAEEEGGLEPEKPAPRPIDAGRPAADARPDPVGNDAAEAAPPPRDASVSGDSGVTSPPPGPIAIPTSYPKGTTAGVHMGADGKLVYEYDENGDTVPDFSHAGYGGGGVPIPMVPVALTLSPVAGEKVAAPRLQAAIDELARKPLVDGFRGALLLRRGVYPMLSGLTIKDSGIVVRGEGDGADGTVLQIVGTALVKIFTITDGGKSPTEVPGTRRKLTDPYVPLGARWFRVESTQGLAVGDPVMVVRPSTANWITAIGMDAYGGTLAASTCTSIARSWPSRTTG
jgi:hypothetical protein